MGGYYEGRGMINQSGNNNPKEETLCNCHVTTVLRASTPKCNIMYSGSITFAHSLILKTVRERTSFGATE